MTKKDDQLLMPLEMQKPGKLPHPVITNRYPSNREAELMTRIVRIESKVHHLMQGHDQMHKDVYEHHQTMVQAINTLYATVMQLQEDFAQFKKEWDAEDAWSAWDAEG